MKKYITDKLMKITSLIENMPVFIAMKHGLVMAVPFIITGCMCLVFTSFPAEAYQSFITGAFGGCLYSALNIVYTFTMGMLAMILLLSVSYSYGRECDIQNSKYYPFVASMAYYIFASDNDGNISIEIFGYNWLFTAIIVALFSSYLLRKFLHIVHKERKIYSDGADRHFNEAVKMIFPVVMIAAIFVLIRVILITIVGDTRVQNIGSAFYMSLFSAINNKFIRGLVFILLSHVFWIFGIHGNNVLNEVSTTLMQNCEFSKSFLDTFVLMGGCGTCICLMLAILITAKRKNNRMLVKAGIIPSIFNISEIFVFGFPIILNPVMIVPFILTPVVCYLIAAAAVGLNIIPDTINSINWTSPVVYSGIKVTGTIMGGVVQIIGIIVGTCIYIPFIRFSEKYQRLYLKESVDKLKNAVIASEEDGSFEQIKESSRSMGSTARMLTEDLHIAMLRKDIEIFYQPQVTYAGQIMGCEALLRWKHPTAGYIYPPLIIAIANNDNCLNDLELHILNEVCNEMEELDKNIKYDFKMSMNITPKQLESDDFCGKAIARISRMKLDNLRLAFEITEQIALKSTPMMNENMNRLRGVGVEFIMDDFGVGHSSMMYLQNADFSIVKLDGSLVRDIMDNNNSVNIIKTIVDLSGRMHFNVIAEYVENEEIKEKLHSIGCDYYQGYLYSKPLPQFEFHEYLLKK